MYELVISGRVVTPDGIIEEGWIAVRGEKMRFCRSPPGCESDRHIP